MLARVPSGAVLGIDAYRVEVEADIAFGIEVFHVVGLPDSAVRESRLRIPAAIENAGYEFPEQKIIVNLAPADIRKDGTAFDLPMAVAVLAANRSIPYERGDFTLGDYLFAGELSLDGELRSIRGALPLAVLARDAGLKGVVLPAENAREASVVEEIEVIGLKHLTEVAAFIRGSEVFEPYVSLEDFEEDRTHYDVDFDEVAGQETVKRALEVAAAGGHNVLLIGPPGSGKSMLSRRIPTILPQMTFEEALETTKVYSVTGHLESGHGLIRRRPFRCPHHTISDVGIIGGGSGLPRPGEVSLAHNGVLFLDEMPEFRRNVLEVMRQPLEDGMVTISRSLTTLSYPASVMLVAAMNPCPCGWFGAPKVKRCHCGPEVVKNYRNRISGPLLDRIDIHADVPAVEYRHLKSTKRGEPSLSIRKRVQRARDIQRERFEGTHVHANAQMSPRLLREHCKVDDDGHRMLENVVDRLGMSARAYDRILKVARTVADLDDSPQVKGEHVAEAVQYRLLDRDLARSR